ncbi:MAG: thiol-disulfide oxidoreductase DCC family protein [bacterium]
MSSLPTQSADTLENSTRSPSWKIKLLYDGECPLCLREVNFLQKQDAGRGLVAFVDIAAENYNPEENGGISFAAAMGRIHAVLADRTIIQNVEVFRQVYDILGIGWIYAATKWPVIGFLVDIIYEIWASWRLNLTGRPNLKTILAERQKRLECNSSNRCSR